MSMLRGVIYVLTALTPLICLVALVVALAGWLAKKSAIRRAGLMVAAGSAAWLVISLAAVFVMPMGSTAG